MSVNDQQQHSCDPVQRRVLAVHSHISEPSRTAVQKIGISPLLASASTASFLRNTSQDPDKGPAALAREREKSSFNTRLMTYFLDGSKEQTLLNEEVMEDLKTLKEYKVAQVDTSGNEIREQTMDRIMRMYGLLAKDGANVVKRESRLDVHSLVDLSVQIRNGVHFGLFMSAIAGQGSDEQRAEWLPRTLMYNITGCFAMTELGHGSNIKGIETTALYDPSTEEFVINTPTDTATKWWIGGAAHTANYSTVFAQLSCGGEWRGVHTFIVQIRDEETHAPMPGITIGDCGTKMGLHGVDNGWLQFDSVRVPLEHMLCKYAQVSPTGTYSKPSNPALAYGALLGTRARFVNFSNNYLKKALVISVRYGAIRRQGGDGAANHAEAAAPAVTTGVGGPGAGAGAGPQETVLLDYATHQYRLMPLLADVYAMNFTATYAMKLASDLEDSLDSNDLSLLTDAHATFAGLKAFSTWMAAGGIETARQACGGQGYSAYNELSRMGNDFAVMCTFEGDNTVMVQQTARYLVGCYRKMLAGQSLTGSVCYLTRWGTQQQQQQQQQQQPVVWSVRKLEEVVEPEKQLEAFSFYASRIVRRSCERFLALCRRDSSRDAATPGGGGAGDGGEGKGGGGGGEGGNASPSTWAEAAPDLAEAAKVHCFYNVGLRFADAVRAQEQQQQQQGGGGSDGVAAVLRTLLSLFMVRRLRDGLAFLLEEGFMTPAHAHLLHDQFRLLCKEVRNQAIPLVDAFNYTDEVIRAPIGRYDGDIYTALLSQARSHALAKEMVGGVDGAGGVAPYYERSIRPVFEAGGMLSVGGG